ncbi:MAG: peptidoglycan-binding protein [Candidatus Taylorbacteria bacterium]|nr:peptidoglycan-binding protein [Candidatus Taylorbacteria bacterium]
METNTPTANKSSKNAYIAGAAIVAIAIAAGLYIVRQNSFCFDFAYDTQFGDKKDFAKASNEAFMGPGGSLYYIPENPALQKALEKEGFFIDELEKTGGNVYLTSFFGPTTQTAVKAFQERYDLAPTGEVDNNMIDVLRERYGCTAKPEPTPAPEV